MALNAFCRALGTVFGGLRDALVEVVRDGDMREHQETDLEQYTQKTRAFYFESPNGEGNYDVDPCGMRDSSS